MNPKAELILSLCGGLVFEALVIFLIVYFTKQRAKVVPNDYQLYGDYVNTNGNTEVQYITYLPEIKQNVYMAVTIDVDNQVFLKMVSEDNQQARFVRASATDVASQIFDPSKWDTYTQVNGHYNVIKPSDYLIYGPNLNGFLVVTYVVYDPQAKQAVFMAIYKGMLIMVTADSQQARLTTASATDTPATLYKYNRWNPVPPAAPTNQPYTVADHVYLLLKKNKQ